MAKPLHNEHFERAWEHLAQYHPTTCVVGDRTSMDMRKLLRKPTKAEWPRYIDAIVEVLGVGQRLGILSVNPARNGLLVIWFRQNEYDIGVGAGVRTGSHQSVNLVQS